MPSYNYNCNICGKLIIDKINKYETIEQCPNCNIAMNKQIGKTTFRLTGSGYYKTDYNPTKVLPSDIKK